MYRKIIAFFCVFSLLFSFAAAEEEEVHFGEDDVDITELLNIVQEETVKDKKDSDGAYIMTVTCTGDFTIGDSHHKKKAFNTELVKTHDGDINFVMQNVRDLFLNDDLTILNFEGTLTPDDTPAPKDKKNNEFLFSIDPEYVSVLSDNGVEAVSLDNNHVWDYGEEGLENTKAALDGAGVIYSTPVDTGIFSFKNEIQVAMLSWNCIDRYGEGFKREKYRREYTDSFLQHDTFEEAVCDEIRKAKEIYPLVIVSFHWGNELMYVPTDNQIRLGRMAAEAGADLIVGNHSHRIQPIERIENSFICYSLGNFCFAGNNKPSDMTSIIFQIRFRVKEGVVSYKDFRVVPIRISSNKDANNYIPTIFEDGYSRDSVLNTLKDNSKGLTYAVTEYPLEFQ